MTQRASESMRKQIISARVRLGAIFPSFQKKNKQTPDRRLLRTEQDLHVLKTIQYGYELLVL